MRKSSVLLGIISVICVTSAAWSWWQLRAERAHVAMLEQRLAALSPREATPAARAATAISRAAVPAPSNSTPAPTAKSATAASNPNQEVVDHLRQWQEREREMLRDPAYRQAQMTQHRRRFAQTRADAIRVVGMTPEQADRVIDLWVERNFRYTEMGGITGQPPGEAMQAEMKRAADAEQAELRTLLGQEKYDQWNHYLASASERAQAGQIQQQLADSERLRDTQIDALAEALYTEKLRLSQDYDEYAKSAGIVDRNIVAPEDRQRWLELAKEANQRIHATMAGTLSQVQLARLDEELAAPLASVEAALRLQLEGKLAKSN